MDYLEFKNNIFSINNSYSFETIALEIFKYQASNNKVYSKFISLLGLDPSKVSSIEDIPFMPIEFFKSHKVISGNKEVVRTFLSSGTTGSVQSKHMVTDLSVYEESFVKSFEKFYGPIEEYTVLGLLPSYLEREGSSLIYMVDYFIKKSNFKESGFYLNNIEELAEKLKELNGLKRKVLLIGVSFALLDFVEKYKMEMGDDIVIMETGGMKGRRKELLREELHSILKEGFSVDKIHSEYGMTELLSQAYSKGDGVFACPPWMKVIIRNTEDPFEFLGEKKNGGINIIDLANINSCSFLATQDLGRDLGNGEFEVVGRFDNSDIRGCNLMVL